MVLLGVKAEGPWLISSWKLAYGVGWMNICKAALCMYPDLIDGEILLAGFASPKRAEISCVDDILNLEESNTLIIRGASRLVKARIEVIFHNQLQFIDVCVERNANSQKPITKISINQYASTLIVLKYICIWRFLIQRLNAILHSSAQYEQRFSFCPITQADYRLHDTADEPRSVSGIPPAQYQASAT